MLTSGEAGACLSCQLFLSLQASVKLTDCLPSLTLWGCVEKLARFPEDAYQLFLLFATVFGCVHALAQGLRLASKAGKFKGTVLLLAFGVWTGALAHVQLLGPFDR